MHWTALLQTRTFPPDATVIDDLPCAGCGYNCRGCRAVSNCPECGRPIGDSLYTLTRPKVVSGGFDLLAKSWLPLFLLYAGCVHTMIYVYFEWIIIGILFITTFFRLWAGFTLRFRANLHHLPLIGTRLRILFGLILLDFAYTAGFTITHHLDMRMLLTNPANIFSDLSVICAGGWALNILLLAWTTGWLGGAMGTLLEYENVEKEFRRQRLLIIIGAILLLLSILTVQFIPFPPGISSLAIILIGLILPGIPFFLALIYTFVGCLHLANAAPHEDQPLDEKIDKPRESFAHRTKPVDPTSPDIPMQE